MPADSLSLKVMSLIQWVIMLLTVKNIGLRLAATTEVGVCYKTSINVP